MFSCKFVVLFTVEGGRSDGAGAALPQVS